MILCSGSQTFRTAVAQGVLTAATGVRMSMAILLKMRVNSWLQSRSKGVDWKVHSASGDVFSRQRVGVLAMSDRLAVCS